MFGLKGSQTRGGISMSRKIACIGAVVGGGDDVEASVLAEYENAKKKLPKNPKSTYRAWRAKVIAAGRAGDASVIQACKDEGIYQEVPDSPKAKRKPKATKVIA